MVWLALLLRSIILKEVGQDFDGAVLDSDEATETFLTGTQRGNLFIISHFPRPQLFEWLEKENVPAIIVLADPTECVRHQMANSGMSALEAVRPVSQSLALAAASRGLSRRAIIRDQHQEIEVVNFASHLAQLCFGRQIVGLVDCLQGLQAWPGQTIRQSIALRTEPSFGAYRDVALPAALGEQLCSICDPLIAMIEGKSDVEIIWHVPFFYDGASHVIPAPIALELVGPARCLYYGPYLHLPVGPYRGGLIIGLSKEIIETYLRVEVFTDHAVAEFMTIVRQGGTFIMPFEMDVIDSQQPIQLRIFIDRGEIQGRIGFANARIQPLSAAPTPSAS